MQRTDSFEAWLRASSPVQPLRHIVSDTAPHSSQPSSPARSQPTAELLNECRLIPTVAAIKAKKDICLANKETLIAGQSVCHPHMFVTSSSQSDLPVSSSILPHALDYNDHLKSAHTWNTMSAAVTQKGRLLSGGEPFTKVCVLCVLQVVHSCCLWLASMA